MEARLSREFRDRLGRGTFVVVADRGMVSAANLQALKDERIEYVISERLRLSTVDEALARAGSYNKVSRNLEVKEIKTDGIERVLACRNLKRAADDARYDDKWVLRTTSNLPPEQATLAYGCLWRVENAFRTS